MKFSCINAELVYPELFQGKDAIVEVPHFPFICKKEEGKISSFEGRAVSRSAFRIFF